MDKFGFDCVCTFGINIMCPSLRSPRISEIKQGGAIEDHPRMLSHTLAMLRLQWPLFSSRNSHVPPTTGPLCPVSMAWEGPPTSFQLIHSYSSFRGWLKCYCLHEAFLDSPDKLRATKYNILYFPFLVCFTV